jgi:hypothetical protein
MAVQPAMWVVGTIKAWWQWFTGSVFVQNCHAGVDFAGKPAGSALVAAEGGIVTAAYYDGVNGGGNVVEVEIRAGVRYSYNHCQSRKVGVGAKVGKGQLIATVGATGMIRNADGSYTRSAYGVHCHTNLLILEGGRWMLYDFADFMSGGSNANDARIKPAYAPTTYPLVRINPGVNIRSTPDLDVGDTNILYVTRADGVYSRATGKKVANLGGWQKRGTTTNDDGGWGKLYGLNRYVYVFNGLYH